MALTMWRNMTNGDRLERSELEQFQERAQQLYRSNPHIFEDERDALGALGVVSITETLHGLDPSEGSSPGRTGNGLPCGLATSVVRFLGGTVT